ncbi:MAG: peptidase [Gammaproteobacteria bacterium]|nr:peptidase [Gammaproteobacteria bacterium]OUV67651.1 MAG: hypothetical protein CBC93_05120 [Gammaproteobacteria bacterium TMED133]
MLRAIVTLSTWVISAFVSGCILLLSAMFLYLNPQLPGTETFSDVTIRAPLRIYSKDGKLIQEFGERLIPITYEEIPQSYIKAILDTEDKRFFEHNGIDPITLLNASWQLIRNRGSIQTGASTITMQLVKNISGDSQVRFIRKFKEMLLAIKIEQELSKEEILTLYLNIIPFGKHAFGVQAAANTYYGKNVDQLNLAQLAMLAGIPKKPEAGNPINGPDWALARRDLVLRRMLEQRSISQKSFLEAIREPITASVHKRKIELPSLYIAEMVRRSILKDFGRTAYSRGLKVHTTVDSKMQLAAEAALKKELISYDRRHGYRGPEYRRLMGTAEYLSASEYGLPENWVSTLDKTPASGGMYPAIITEVNENSVQALTHELRIQEVSWEDMKWARKYIDVNTREYPGPQKPADVVAVGDLIRIKTNDGTPQLGQIPKIQGALVALAPNDGAIRALVGGFDFNNLQFNHATQARRQPGSNFKPFFYAGALEQGLTAATIYNDAPFVLPGGGQEETYRPKNSGDEFKGNISIREALYQSINLVSLRVILDYGPENAVNYVSRFGFDTSNFPNDVQLAFGGGTIAVTPLEIATAYASFANGGFKITPYLIERIDSGDQDVMIEANPKRVCVNKCEDINTAPRIIEERVAYIMNSILADAISKGTGRKVMRAFKRSDIKGKTGTTNDADIWFSGYTTDIVATVWAGFSDNSPVGSREFGSTTPIAIWIDFMNQVIQPEKETSTVPTPDGLVTVRIDRDTGLRADPQDLEGEFEIFRTEYAPIEVISDDTEIDQSLQEIF